jgi:2-polyprenyl-3-methyl-5-hydroxy-6-metoxy-1,4-benzoquinol methylase
MPRSLPQSYFENLYASDPDPWRFETSEYERDKYARTLDLLGRYQSALEVGCSIGVLTARLAERCEKLLAIDIASAPILAARRRCRGLEHVTFAQMAAPGEWPGGSFDLVLLSEVVYYLDVGDVQRLAQRVLSSTSAGGDIVLAHWTGLTDYPLSGDEASELFLTCVCEFADIVRQQRAEKFRLDLVRRR